MLKEFTYAESKSTKWLSIILVSLSCFAFSLSPVPADARQILPTNIEQLVSAKGDDDKSIVSFQKIVPTDYLSHSTNRSREHEKNVMLTYQIEIQVHFIKTSESYHSFVLPALFISSKIISDDSDEGYPPHLLV